MYMKQIFDLRSMTYKEIQDYVWYMRGNAPSNDVYRLYCAEVEHYMTLRFKPETVRNIAKWYYRDDECAALLRKVHPTIEIMYDVIVGTATDRLYPFKLLK